ncbi:UNVERIFIED_CONTAM: hypothetical protein GTU68_030587 [Idotea baltica]|nr:hypothetical protein [Idotea baltica]
MLALLNEGDEVILPSPFWVSYAAQVNLAGGTLVQIPTKIDQDFKITAQELSDAISEKTKLFLYSSPCNPTGSVYTKEELASLVEVLVKHPNIIVISDEIYEFINFTDKHCSIGEFESMKDRVITVNGLSKGYAMTGWRLGYMGAPLKIAQACNKIQGQFTSGTCSITQRAAIEALNGTMAVTKSMKAEFLARRDMVLGLLNEIPGLKANVPQGAFYIFPNVSAFIGKSFNDKTIENVDDLTMYILNEGLVSLVTGKAFGNENCLRISYAASEAKLREAMKRLKDCLTALA